jgi:hypothetical protein
MLYDAYQRMPVMKSIEVNNARLMDRFAIELEARDIYLHKFFYL